MDASLAYGGFLLSMGGVWGLFGYLRALRMPVRRRFCTLPDLGGYTSGFRRGGRSGFPRAGLGPLLAALNGRRAPTARQGGGG